MVHPFIARVLLFGLVGLGACSGSSPARPATGGSGGASSQAGTSGSSGGAGGASVGDASSGGAGAGDSGQVEAGAPDTAGDMAAGNPDAGNKPPVAPSAGCNAADQLPEGMATLPGGRPYAVHLPTGYDRTKPYPLVFALHPNGGDIAMFNDQNTRTVMKAWAILVRTQSETGDWREAFPADLAYFDALVPLLKDKLCVDTNRIYSFGFSGGGSFSNLLACKRNFLRAVGSGGGVPGYDGYTAADCRPMPAWIDEGDRVGLLELWTAKNGCSQQLPGNRPNCGTYVCAAAPVVYCTNSTHTWPTYASGDVSAFFSQF
jgi:polyhydroxybutyrate depolymerase